MSKTKSRVSSGQTWLQLGQLRAEKCELKEARVAYEQALREARRTSDTRTLMEALAGLLRLASDALDEHEVERLDSELTHWMNKDPKRVPPIAFYCKGAVARAQNEFRQAQRNFYRYILAVRKDPQATWHGFPTTRLELEDRGWAMIAVTFLSMGKVGRAEHLAQTLMPGVHARKTRGVEATLCLLLGNVYEGRKQYKEALREYQKAHGLYLSEHNWYYHLFVLNAYARIQRLTRNYEQALWHLELIERACTGPEFRFLLKQVALERRSLEDDAVDLMIDSRKGMIKTRESGVISLRKQYILLNILEALGEASRGLSKAELIERVWRENYRPEAHDNKLYYNINRLRKLIEPDVRKPQYLLNWKEGYRLAPGLRVQWVKESSTGGTKKNADS